MKYEWRKKDKEIYLPKTKPEIIKLEKMKYLTINGEGNPNSEEFSRNIQKLYSLSYAIRMMPKKGITPDGYFEYTVFPLEGIWDLDEEGRKLDYLDKNYLVYKIMIRQPDFVDDNVFKQAIDIVKSKKNSIDVEDVKLEEINEGLNLQMMHIGSFDNEKTTFDIMERYCQENNLKRIEKIHKEIYISDVRRVKEEKLKTVLRFKIEKI